MLDVILRGGTVVDGSGRARVRADVGVREGRVVEIGRVDESARRVIDVDGLVVAPGFVDVHTHYDAQLFWDPMLSPSSLHGFTSMVAGNCGFTVAPLTEASAPYVLQMLARVEGMPTTALEQGLPWSWRTTGEYLAAAERELGVNVAFFVGHSTLRRAVMGEAASERAATADEVESMAGALRESLAAGAIGLSTSWARSHNDHQGRPVPSLHAAPEESIRLAEVCGEFDGTAIEATPKVAEMFDDDLIELMITMAVRSRRPFNWNGMQVTAANLDICVQRLGLSDAARARGGRIIGLAHAAVRQTQRYSFFTGQLLDVFPGWDEVMALAPTEKLRVLSDPTHRRRLDELAQSDANPLRNLADWPTRRIEEVFAPELKRYEGRFVGDIAREEHKEPFDALLDICCADGLRTTFAAVPAEGDEADWAAREQIWRDERTVLGGSDAGAHLDMIASYSYSTQFMQQAVRERQMMTLEEGVKLLTADAAAMYGLHERGRLEVGRPADITVFDAQQIGTGPVRTVFDLPGGAPRLYCDALGVRDVFVNGEQIVDDGSYTDARPGKVLRSGTDFVTAT